MKKPSLFGKYLLLERLNVGGMAEVFAAKAFGVEGFERILAIKKILPTMAEDEEFITMFIDEARISVQLNHANVVHIHELGKHDDAYYIAMEYVAGKDLRALLERFRRRKEIMPTAMAVFCATKICEGLDYAHRKKDARGQELSIIHRDVSPQNILVSYEGEVKIIDFGIAKAANRSQKTQAGILKGKFGYMSPEQVRGLPIDRRSDIFAVGVILYEMLTGEKLFVGESDFSTLEKVRNAEVPLPRQFNPNIPPGLEKVVMKALAREVEDRYQWSSDLQEDLMRFLLAGDAIYSAKHMAAFMKDAFAEDLLRENEKMERFASAERPESVESSGITTSPGVKPSQPRRNTNQGSPLAALGGGNKPKASVAVAGGSGAVAMGMQSARVDIPPPSAEELAEMDRGGDRTMIVDSSNPAGNELQTAIGVSPFSGGAVPDSTAPAGRQLRPAAPTSGNSDTHDNLPTAGGRPGGPRSLRDLPADETLVPTPRSALEDDTGSHDLRPIETTGFRPALEVDAEASTGPQNTPEQLDSTIPPRNVGKPKIVIGDAPVSGATSIGPSPFAGNETRMFQGSGGDEEEQQQEYDEQEQAQDDDEAYEQDQAQDDYAEEEEPEQAEVPTGQRAPVQRRVTPRGQVKAQPAGRSQPKAAPADGKRKGLLIAIAATAVLAVVVIGAAAFKFVGAGPKSGVYIRASQKEVSYTLTVNPGQVTVTDPTEAIELAPGEYNLEFRPTDPAYLVHKRLVSVKEGKTEAVTVTFARGEPAKDPRPDDPAPPPKDPVAPPDTPVKDPTPAAPTTWVATITSSEPGVEIALDGKKLGVTPNVEVKGLELGKSYDFSGTKSGFEPLSFTLSNADKKEKVEKVLTLVKIAVRQDPPPPKPKPDPVVQADPPPPKPKPDPVVRADPPPKPKPDLVPPKPKGSGKLACTSKPVGAEIWINGRNTGKKTPLPKTQALELPYGKHKILFKLDGKSSAVQEITITEANKDDPLVVKGEF